MKSKRLKKSGRKNMCNKISYEGQWGRDVAEEMETSFEGSGPGGVAERETSSKGSGPGVWLRR